MVAISNSADMIELAYKVLKSLTLNLSIYEERAMLILFIVQKFHLSRLSRIHPNVIQYDGRFYINLIGLSGGPIPNCLSEKGESRSLARKTLDYSLVRCVVLKILKHLFTIFSMKDNKIQEYLYF